MLKLMKYEIRKQLISKLLLLGFFLFFEMLYLAGIFSEKDGVIKLAHAIFLILAVFGMLYLMTEPAMVIYSDLGKKQGYLLFMTPNSVTRIVGAKVFAGVLLIFIYFSLVIGFTAINEHLLSGYLNRDVDSLSNTFNAFGDSGFSLRELIVTLFMISIMSLDFITLAFLSICISYSYMTIGKVNSLLSILLFFLLLIIETLFVGVLFVLPASSFGNVTAGFVIISNLLFALPASINFIGAVRLIERRINL